MAYTSQGFADGQVLSAAKLTNIEQAILDNDIIASGTSGIWNYIKYANGTAILYSVFTESLSHYTTWIGGNAYQCSTNNFPFTFTSIPAVGYGAYVGNGFALNARAVVTKETVQFFVLASASGTQTVEIQAIVIGRWK